MPTATLILASVFASLVATGANLTSGNTSKLQPLDVGPYAELVKRANPDKLVLMFQPSLVSTLAKVEKTLARRVTGAECLRMKDKLTVMALNSKEVGTYRYKVAHAACSSRN